MRVEEGGVVGSGGDLGGPWWDKANVGFRWEGPR